MGRAGLEPATYGLKVRYENRAQPNENAQNERPLLGFCAASDPDEAVKAAIHAAVEAGRYDLATRLIEVLRASPPVADVVPLRAVRVPRDG